MFLENEKMVSVHFESITDLLGFDFDSVPHGHVANQYLKSKPKGTSWFGSNVGAEKVIENGLLGDSELLVKLESKIKSLSKIENQGFREFAEKVQKVKRKRCFSDQGDELDIEKVYNGQLDTAWSKTERIQMDSTHNLITILIDNGGHCGLDATDSFWRSAVSVMLADQLLKAGKSVKIMIGASSSDSFTNSKKRHTSSCVVKNYNESLSMDRLAAMTHLGFFRTFSFASFAMTKHKPCGSLGHSVGFNSVSDYPLGMQDEISKGHTKIITIGKCDSEYKASNQLLKAYQELAA